MTHRRLTDFEQILLGMICASPSSGYDLKRTFAATPMGVYHPSSGALYPALRRLQHAGLVQTPARLPAGPARRRPPRRVYHATKRGREVHSHWVRTPVEPATISRELALHLMRFVMMEPLLPRIEVLAFLESLRDALATAITELERYSEATDFENRHAPLALDHGIATHRTSLAWAKRTITALSAAPAAQGSTTALASPTRDHRRPATT
jgi:DNA-binding PadR family transcriptional regulator